MSRHGMGAAVRHDSAVKHVRGEARYIDDLLEPTGLLHACLGIAERPHARIVAIDLGAVRDAPGVVDVITAADIPGLNDVSPTHRHDEPLLAEGEVHYVGQPVFAVAATSRDAARRAARLAQIAYEELDFVIDLTEARDTVTPGMTMQRGDVRAALDAAPHRIDGRVRMGGQDHFYLEGQIGMALPGEDGDVTVFSSTQHPSEVQTMVAQVLGIAAHGVTVEIRRMGGGFGGKETQGNLFACIAAVLARRNRRPVKIRPDRDDDMIITGKRHGFLVDYSVGFDDDGRIHGVDMRFDGDCGWSSDLSGPVTDRALFHADNAYFYPAVRLQSRPLRTNTVSNTAFRGFGGPQGMVACERMIEDVAFATGLDPLIVRKRNFYGRDERNVTPYHQTIDDNIIDEIVSELEEKTAYARRREAIRRFNGDSPVIRRGIALTPVKFGISFTLTAFNQAGALVHVYRDGSVHLNHGGTEMGQGLHTKVAQVVADVFAIDLDRVKITATTTGKVPNTSATAASSGADLNGKAAEAAALTIRQRLVDFACEKWSLDAGQIEFEDNHVRIGNQRLSFAELVDQAYFGRISLSSTGFYKTPDIHWDREAGRGHPFYYFAYGAACSEVAIDRLTGEYRVLRTDILHDVGRSLSPDIDRGQVEGGFIQGMGWLTTEELVWKRDGALWTHAPSTYKIPVMGDRPPVFNVELHDRSINSKDTIFRSKAVGEPPFMLGISVLHALSDAVASVAGYRHSPRLDAPATPERILTAVRRLEAMTT